jgi:hypothetical protein
MATKNVSFYGQGPLNAIQAESARDPRNQMFQALMQKGVGNVQSPMEGLTKALTQGVGGYFAGKAAGEADDRMSKYSKDMATVMAGGAAKPWINPDTGTAEVPMGIPNDVGGLPDINLGIDDGTGGSVTNQDVKMVPTAPAGGYEGMMAALSKIDNPDMAGFGQQISMAQMQQQQEARQAEIARIVDMEDFFKKEAIRARFATPKDTRTPEMINAEAIGGAPGTPGYIEALKNLTKKTPLIGGELEMEEDKAFGKELVKQYSIIQEAANVSENAINQIEQARAFVDTDSTGAELPSVLQQKVGNVITALGGDVTSPGTAKILGNITNGQQFVAVTKNIVLSKMQAQKGPQTAADTAMIEKTVASLGNTPEARDFLLRSAQAVASEDMFKADFWRNHRSATGSFQGAAGEWAKFRKNVPFLAVSKGTGKPVFFADFVRANRGADMRELIQDWTANYGK